MINRTDNDDLRPAWVYIIECADGTLYTGWCYVVEARLAQHNSGRGARYTRGRGPVHLRWCEPHPTKRAAMQRERFIKRLRRIEKLKLIERGTIHNVISE